MFWDVEGLVDAVVLVCRCPVSQGTMTKQHLSREGFLHNGQVVYAVQYDLATTPSSSLIDWLDADGKSLHPWVRPTEPGNRMVTVKPGDVILHNGEPRTVAGVSVYRALPMEPGGKAR